jgi:hypothetical protein
VSDECEEKDEERTRKKGGRKEPGHVAWDFAWKAVSWKALKAGRMVQTCWEIEIAQYVDSDCFIFIDKSYINQKTSQCHQQCLPLWYYKCGITAG